MKPSDMPGAIDRVDFARTAYEAYAQSTGGKTFDGRDMPTFAALPDRIKAAWADAERAAFTAREVERAKLTNALTFGAALERLKSGERIARDGWNGKGMWLALMPGMTVPEGMVNARTKAFVPSGDLHVDAYIVMWTADGTWQPGWLASQADMLATDWYVTL